MAGWALAALGLYFLLCFGLRSVIQLRKTGSSGFYGISGRPGSVEWIGGVLFVVALALGVLAPVADLAGWIEPLGFDGTATRVAGLAAFALGLAGTLAAQLAMGSSWRIGVDQEERTELVTSGPFALVRNPIFAGMIPTSIGVALLVPNWIAIAGVLALWTALEIQTRLVEEPYLKRVQGSVYIDYASRTGRFVPGIGTLKRPHTDSGNAPV